MAIVYSVTINDVRVHTQGDLVDVVKEIDANITGTENTSVFALPITLVMPPADPTSFTPFADLTEAQVVAWVEGQTAVLEPHKAHIAFVLAKMVEQATLSIKPLPWAPPPPPPPPPAPVSETVDA